MLQLRSPGLGGAYWGTWLAISGGAKFILHEKKTFKALKIPFGLSIIHLISELTKVCFLNACTKYMMYQRVSVTSSKNLIYRKQKTRGLLNAVRDFKFILNLTI